MSESAFVMQGVRRRLGDFELLIDQLELQRGSVLGLVGRNGAGKTTTIHILMNLIYPDRGQVAVLGRAQPGAEREIRRRVGYVGEAPSYDEGMTVGANLKLVRRFYPTWDEQLARQYLQEFELDPRRKVKQLSRGQRVRLALTLALAHRPELLLLDEPTSGIDPVMRRELLEQIAAVIHDEERSVVFSSHITQDVERVADHVAVLDQGRIVELDDTVTLLDRWRRVSGTVARTARDVGTLFRSERREDGRFVGITDAYSPAWCARLRAAGATEERAVRIGLDEVMLTLCGKEA